jgi:hypothetical protein
MGIPGMGEKPNVNQMLTTYECKRFWEIVRISEKQSEFLRIREKFRFETARK